MRVAVDEDRCRGHGVCFAICPDVFVLTDDGYAEVPEPEVPAALEHSAREAAENCPERAITLS
ncbi:ferredoxin [Prauserella endophytica]|uniref:Ferredoxin n=1 Tax=Prauserella endophytica TaxID=1592324 RepID=A0ABY2S5Q9_9PSEU|nr:ferredoxin [Prauserella endophytica]PXY33329.1 ferredoxin [Prauserella coralliicola]TKG70907.1 ferredoxin [Prauserella endophytica]